jgi:hypothetical protein
LFFKIDGGFSEPFCVTKSHGDRVERKQRTKLL